MAERVTRIFGGTPVVTAFEIDEEKLMRSGLKIRIFNGQTWHRLHSSLITAQQKISIQRLWNAI